MFELLVLIVIGSAIWVYFDADKIGLGGGWAAGTLFLWIIFFPWYLIERRNVLAATSAPEPAQAPSAPSGGAWHLDPRDPSRERWREGTRWSQATRAREASPEEDGQ